MQCVINANNLKEKQNSGEIERLVRNWNGVFGKAIHALARIGTELYIEDITTGLALRTVNSSKSAYASITFKQGFFFSYESGINSEESEVDETVKCKVDMKACLAIFKSLSVIEKTIERCTLDMDNYDTKLRMKLYCVNDVVKTIQLCCIESESLKTVFSKDECCNYISAVPNVIRCAFNSFRPNQEEVTLKATKDLVVLNNYVDDCTDAGTIKVLHTERRLDPEEFLTYQIENDTEITFSLKDLRAVLVFSDTSDESVSIYFDAPGRPVVFVVQDQHSFEGNFVFATLDSDENQQENKNSKNATATTANMTQSHIKISENSKLDSPANARHNTKATFEPIASTSSAGVLNKERSLIQKEFSCDSEPSPPEKRLRSMSSSNSDSEGEKVYEVLASDTDESD